MDRLTDTFLIHLMLRGTKPGILLDFEQTAKTCLSHERLSEMRTPRSFSTVEIPRACSFNSSMAITGLSFLVIRYRLHSDSLKGRPIEDDQEARFLKSACSNDEFS